MIYIVHANAGAGAGPTPATVSLSASLCLSVSDNVQPYQHRARNAGAGPGGSHGQSRVVDPYGTVLVEAPIWGDYLFTRSLDFSELPGPMGTIILRPIHKIWHRNCERLTVVYNTTVRRNPRTS